MTKSGGTYLGKIFENRENMFFTRIEEFWVKKNFQKIFFSIIQNPENRPYSMFFSQTNNFANFFRDDSSWQ